MNYYFNDLYYNILLKIKEGFSQVYTNNQKLLRRITFVELNESDIIKVQWVPELTSYDDHCPENINKYICIIAEATDLAESKLISIIITGTNNLIERIEFPKNCIYNIDITNLKVIKDNSFLNNIKEVKTLSRMFKKPENTIVKYLDINNSFSYWEEKYYYSIKKINSLEYIMIDKKGNMFLYTHKKPNVLRTQQYYQYKDSSELQKLNKNIYNISIEDFLRIIRR